MTISSPPAPKISPEVLARKFAVGENVYDVDADTWRRAFDILDANQVEYAKDAVHTLWIESGGHLRRKIRDDGLILRVLRRALPGYAGDGRWLYRGECAFLFDVSKIGFCWTEQIEVAECFASGTNAVESGGVLVKAYAPGEAILAGPNGTSEDLQEIEFTCDPTRMQAFQVVRRFPRPPSAHKAHGCV